MVPKGAWLCNLSTAQLGFLWYRKMECVRFGMIWYFFFTDELEALLNDVETGI